MRLLLVSQEYPPDTAHGGIATQTRQKALGLQALGHQVTVLAHAGPAGPGERWDGAVRVLRLAGPDADQPIRTEAARWLCWSARVAAAVERLLTERPCDLVEFVDWGSEGFVWLHNRDRQRLPRAAVHLQGPLCLLARGLGWPEPGSELERLGSFMEGACLRLADAVLSSSHFSAEACALAYGLDPTTIPVAHTGVDLEQFHPPTQPPAGAPRVLFVGRVAPSKGADVLTEAVLRIASRFPGLRLRLVGRDDTGLGSRLRERAATAGFPDLLELPGAIDRARLPAEFGAATLFAAPSPCEGGPGFVFLEAMACGLPAVGCAGTGVGEAIEDGVTGRLVPIGDTTALAAALGDLLADPARRQAMGRAARAAMRTRADSRTCVRRLGDLYQAIVTGPAGPRADGRTASPAG